MTPPAIRAAAERDSNGCAHVVALSGGKDIPFFRFTGSEIWRDAKGCMLEVENLLWREMFGRDCPLRKYDEEEG